MAEEILLDEARSECLIVLVTATSAEEATTLARTLVEEKLAACVSRFPVQSTYTWEGNIEEDEEWQLVIKTHRRQFHPLQVRVQGPSIAMRFLKSSLSPSIWGLRPISTGLATMSTERSTETLIAGNFPAGLGDGLEELTILFMTAPKDDV